jgi:hypothetical protein
MPFECSSDHLLSGQEFTRNQISSRVRSIFFASFPDNKKTALVKRLFLSWWLYGCRAPLCALICAYIAAQGRETGQSGSFLLPDKENTSAGILEVLALFGKQHP